MKRSFKDIFKRAVCAGVIFGLVAPPSMAATLSLAQTPLYLGSSIPPQVMLDITRDQQLFKKAYNDYSDLDGDGVIETTYSHAIDYYGYFDSYKCYTYSATNMRFEPAVYNTKNAAQASNSTANLAAKYCSASGGQSDTWSGNYLNWASMTRIDTVRKLLFGGLRSPSRINGDGIGIADGDTTTGTVLERAHLPTDAHSFAKYYAGSDLSRLTPFTNNLAQTTSVTSRTIATGDQTFTLSSAAGFSNGDVTEVALTSDNTKFMRGVVKNKAGNNITLNSVVTLNLNGAGTTATAWTVRNLSTQGISICNTTEGSSTQPQDRSQTNTNLPRMKIAQGNFSIWAGNERWQCLWMNQNDARNGNDFQHSGLASSSSSPDRTVKGLDNKQNSGGRGDYFVRIQACVPGLVGTEKCKEYDQNNFVKPIGLLQVYGDPNLIHFGLMTGSFNKNVSGGVLRKNVSPLADEINSSGQFTVLPASGVPGGVTLPSGQTSPAGGSIIKNLSLLKITGYKYNDGTYIGNSGSSITAEDNCNFQLTTITQGFCRSWGNPMSEVYYESLRYFAGHTAPTTAFNTDDTNRLAQFATATWPSTSNVVLSQKNYCAPLNVLLFNASVVTGETDNQIGNPFVGLSFNAVAQTNLVGNAEGVAAGGANAFVGRTSAAGSNASTDNEYCDAKSSTGLGNMYGVCPEGPTLGGSYLMAGLAYAAHVNRIRNDFTVPASDTKSLKVNTYGIALASNTPQIPVQLAGESTARVILQPVYRLFNSSPQGGGSLVDLQILSQTSTATRATGRIYLNWEDSEQGGDYDQDMWGILSYDLDKVANTITITTRVISQATANPQGFGYIISGTSKDGPHFHSGIHGFNFTDPKNITVTPNTNVNASGGCNNCNVGNATTSVTYTLSNATPAVTLKDPLWYAAKWGGFKDQNNNNLPDLVNEWDGLLASGAPGYDGMPDNYFLVVNPLGLEAALDKALIQILVTSAASSAATNSTSLNTGSKIYQARFSGGDWAGQMLAFGISTTGVINDTADWDGGQVSLSPATVVPNSRNIITSYQTGTRTTANVRAGIPFRWPTTPATPAATELPVAMTDHLRRDPVNLAVEDATRGSDRLNYLRGDGTNEGVTSKDFRRRTVTKLGDTVNANPIYVGAPNAGYADASYAAFRNTNLNRSPMLYTAANDGMLHVFNVSSGAEVMAYVPQQVYRNLSQLTSKTYAHRYYIDASPEVQDAKFTKGTANAPDTGSWSTVLVGGLGGGGQGMYALNVTDPTTFTEANANSKFLWTFDDKDDPDMGNVFGNVSIRKMANGKWAAIVGSGYNNSDAGASATNAGQAEVACTAGDGVITAYTPADCTTSRTGYAYVFIIYLSGPTGSSGQWVSGTDYVKIPAGTVGTAGTPNGLVSPFPLDKDLNGSIDYIYAGDLNGNLWKFDVSSATSTNWTSTANQKVLFTASANQAITSSPIVAQHISGSGYMVNVGTGKYIESADKNTTTAQSYYGIWDKDDASPINGQTTVLRSELMPQWVLAETTVATQSLRVTSNHQPNYAAATRTDTLLTEPTATSTVASTPVQKGWYFDFPGTPGTTLVGTPLTGERAAFDPLLISGRLIFTTILPTAATCASGGSSYLMVLNNQTGGRFGASPFDANRDGVINSSDLVSVVIGGVTVQVPASGLQSAVGITPKPTIISGGGGAGLGGTITVGSGGSTGGVTGGSGATGGIAGSVAVISDSGGGLTSVLLNLGKTSGRISWREVFLD